jgi:hypothetical protein
MHETKTATLCLLLQQRAMRQLRTEPDGMTDLVLYQVFNTACILKETLKYFVRTGFLRRT